MDYKSSSRFRTIFKNLAIIIVLLAVLIRCQRFSGKDNQQGLSRIEFELEWVKLADSKGELDVIGDSTVVEAAEFSDNEEFIATGSCKGKELMVWDSRSGEKLFEHKFANKLEIVTFSLDNQFLLAGGEFNSLYIWNTGDWSLFKTIELPSGIEGMSYSDNGKMLALGREDGMVLLVDTKDFTIKDSLLHGYKGAAPDYSDPYYRADVNSIDFSPDGKYLITGGLDGDIKIWHLPGLKLIKTINGHNSSIKSVRINNLGNCFASASSGEPYTGDNTIKLWDFKSGDMLHKLSSPLGMEAVEFNPSGKFLIGGAREVNSNGLDQKQIGYIYVYYIPEDFLTEPIRLVHRQPVPQSDYFHFNNDGSRMVSGHEDGSVRVWKVMYK